MSEDICDNRSQRRRGKEGKLINYKQKCMISNRRKAYERHYPSIFEVIKIYKQWL